MKKISAIILALCAGLCFACVPQSGTETGKHLTIAAEGGSQTLTMDFAAAWSIIPEAEWITVSPMSGSAGTAELTVTATANAEYDIREGVFYILDGAKTIVITATQACADAIVLKEAYYAPMDDATFTISVGANVEYTVTSDQDWITPIATKAYAEKNVDFKVVKNPTDQPRTAKLTFTGGTVDKTVDVIQSGWVDIDWEAGFYKRLIGVRFTACWCGNCPRMAISVKNAQAERPDRLVEIAFHPLESDKAEIMSYSGTAEMGRFLGVRGYPSFYLDQRADVYPNDIPDNVTCLVGVIDESVASYAPHCGIEMTSKIEGGKINVKANVYAEQGGDYKLAIVVVENNIELAQDDYDDVLEDPQHCIHNNIVRDYMTDLFGDSFTLADNGSRTFEYSKSIPAKTLDQNNLAVVAYIIRPAVEGTPAAVARVTYKNIGGEIVDNVVSAPIGSTAELQYEK